VAVVVVVATSLLGAVVVSVVSVFFICEQEAVAKVVATAKRRSLVFIGIKVK
jgi:hypothetical protein